MKNIVILGIITLVVAVSADEVYTSKFDNTNVEEILNNKRLLENYIKCCLDEGPCTPEGKELKSHIKESLENRCAKCTKVQKGYLKQVIGHLIHKEPDYWNQLKAKYDPEGKYTIEYEKELKEVQGN